MGDGYVRVIPSQYFTKNQQPTITTKNPNAARLIGNRYFPSFNDIHLANLMYSCAGACVLNFQILNWRENRDPLFQRIAPNRSPVPADSKAKIASVGARGRPAKSRWFTATRAPLWVAPPPLSPRRPPTPLLRPRLQRPLRNQQFLREATAATRKETR